MFGIAPVIHILCWYSGVDTILMRPEYVRCSLRANELYNVEADTGRDTISSLCQDARLLYALARCLITHHPFYRTSFPTASMVNYNDPATQAREFRASNASFFYRIRLC